MPEFSRSLVASPLLPDLLLCARHLSVAATLAARGSSMGNGGSGAPVSERDLASIPMAHRSLARLAVARLERAGVPVAPLLRRAGLTPELIADPDRRLRVRSQIAFLDEAAIALKDDCLGLTLARDFDPREIGLLYYVMASSRTLGDALRRASRYSRITNEALVIGYREGNRVIVSLGYAGVPRHSDRHQLEFCMFAAIRLCRVLTGQNLVPQYVRLSIIDREAPPTWCGLPERRWSSAPTRTNLPWTSTHASCRSRTPTVISTTFC